MPEMCYFFGRHEPPPLLVKFIGRRSVIHVLSVSESHSHLLVQDCLGASHSSELWTNEGVVFVLSHSYVYRCSVVVIASQQAQDKWSRHFTRITHFTRAAIHPSIHPSRLLVVRRWWLRDWDELGRKWRHQACVWDGVYVIKKSSS